MATSAENIRGAVMMTVTMAGFVLNDACMKGLSSSMPLSEAMFLRGLITSVLVGSWVWWKGLHKVRLSRDDQWRVGWRTAGEVIAAFFFISALFHMPLANVTAIMQVLPLVVTLAGAMFFSESLGWRRLLAIAVGFCGVVLIVRPGPEGFNSYTVYALLAVLAVTLRDLMTRKISGDVSSLTVALWASLGIMALGAVMAPGDRWVWPTSTALAQLAGASGFVILAYITSVSAMRFGDIGFVSPFRYTGLLWALALGFVFFGEWPHPLTLLGAGIVVATGVFTLLRERRLHRLTANISSITTRVP